MTEFRQSISEVVYTYVLEQYFCVVVVSIVLLLLLLLSSSSMSLLLLEHLAIVCISKVDTIAAKIDAGYC